MVERCAFLFPGQGAYLPGALGRLAADEPLVAETLRELDAVAVRLGRAAPSRLLLDERAPALEELVRKAPADLHVALFAAEMALFRLLTERHHLTPDVLLGHSFGELVALTAAGALDLADGLALVAARDDAFAAQPPPPGGMVALELSAARTAALLAGLGEWGVSVAADNSPRQCVVSGPAEGLERVRWKAEAVGIRATALPVPYAFHHRLLAAVAGEFTRRAAALHASPTRHLLHSAILGRRVDDGDAVAELVSAHLVRPTRFTDAVRLLHAEGVEVFVECGPRGVLSDLVAATVPGVRALAPLRRRTSGPELTDELHSLTIHQFVPPPQPLPPPHPPRTTPTPSLDTAPSPDTAHDDSPTHDEVVSVLRALYAAALGYPPEVLTADADLEADLGVDSIKQTELFAQAVTRFGRALPTEGTRLTSHTTLDALAELLPTLPPRHSSAPGTGARP
ncbi:acyltransferase domain-containing protein [Kitasatospora cineracea]|uniref:Malonyl CoA-acyl carrier protein transacylase n=1 Tax=Kitasatospora cineracea TaxID=88074 RepID=A0A3N4S0R2_9ACTN|nr:acyltransferase domain-containing protein [Kitasatospora cineracea]RPE36809.1 malonyl CoA-acyl carrier protein transacylase [Kitasatospora cineracea]